MATRKYIAGRTDIEFGMVREGAFASDEYVEVEADLTSLGGSQSAYFSATYDAWDAAKARRLGSETIRRCEPHSCGAGVENYAEHFPELRRFFKWHLCSIDTGPLHYLANGTYWIELARQGGDDSRYASEKAKTAVGCWEIAESTVVWGALKGEVPGTMQARIDRKYKGDASKMLKERFPALIRKFHSDMVALFGLEAVQEAVEHARKLRASKEESH